MHPWSHNTPKPTMVCLARDGRTCPLNICSGTLFNLCWKVGRASDVVSIRAPVAVDARRGVCVGIIVIASSGCIAIILAPESSILGIVLILFLIVEEF